MKKFTKTLILFLLLILTAFQFSLNSVAFESEFPTRSIQGINAYIEGGPIEILNDSAFGPTGYNFNGTGTINDPYLLENFNITDSSAELIHIENTTSYFAIRNSYLNSSGAAYTCLKLVNVTNSIIENNTICDSNNHQGINLDNCDSITIINNTLYDFQSTFGVAIWLGYTNNSVLSNNSINDCQSVGIYLDHSYNNIILNNTIEYSDGAGIMLYLSNFNIVNDNTIFTIFNGAGILLHSANNNSFSYNTIFDMFIGAHGINLQNSCNNNTFRYNTIYQCDWGIYLELAGGSSCIGNDFYANIIYNTEESGIHLDHALNTTISRNAIYQGDRFGITLYQSNYTTITYNNIYDNDEEGIMFQVSSDNNTVHWNNFINNNHGSPDAYDECSKNNITSNFWDEYIGTGNYSIAGMSMNEDTSPLSNPVPPLVTIDSPMNAYYSTNNIEVKLSGTCIHYWFYLEGIDGMNQTWKPDSSYAYSLPDGTYTLYAFGNDTLGNNGSTSVTFVIDQVAPTVDITSPTSSTYNKTNITLTYTTSDGVVIVYIDGVANTTAYQSGSFILDLTDGVHNITITASDQAGNKGIDTVIFTIDTTIDTTTSTGATSFPGLFTILMFCMILVIGFRKYKKI